MRNKHLFGMALAAVMTAACNFVDEPMDAPRNGGLSATVEGSRSSTRAGFDKDGAFYWSNEDYLGVTTDQCMTSFTQLKLTSGGGTAKAGFEGSVFGKIEGYAVYPVSNNHRLNDKILTYHLPETYEYKDVDEDYFTTTQGDGNSFNPPMWGSIIDNGNNKAVTLQHLGGVLCVKIPEMPVEAGTFILSADEPITGDFTADLSKSDPVIATLTVDGGSNGAATTATSAVSGNNVVTITFSEATQGSPGVFYVPVPTGTYHNVRVKVTDGTTAKVNVVAGVYTVNRKDLKKIEPTSGSVEATVATESGSLTDAADALANNDAVAVTSEITSGSTIEIPAVSSSSAKSLSLEKVATGASLAVTDGNTTGNEANSVDNFTLSIPNDETPDFTPLDVTITMPNTTVTLAGNGGVATYGNVTASTAENTLVLSSGVEVKKLTVAKGNIRVNKGATLTEVVKAADYDAVVKVYVEEGAVIPMLPAGFEVVADDELMALKMAATKGGSYTMTGDLTLDEPLVVETGVTFTLDLNGHALKANAAGLTKVLNTSDAVVLVRRGATLTIDDSSNGQGSIDANGVATVYGAVKLTDTKDGATGDIAKLIVNGGQLKGYYYGIVGNGTRHDTEIIVNGGKVMNTSDAGSAIYHPQAGTLTVKGGEIVGADTGIELRSGTLKMEGGIVRCTNTANVTQPNGNGTSVSGAALAISQHTTDKEINVTISGGTLTGPYALYEEDLQNENVNNIQITGVSGGTFNGKIYSENCTQFISGGTFSDPSALAYLKDGADLDVVLNSDVTVDQNIIVHVPATVGIDLSGNKLTFPKDARVNIKKAAVTFQNGSIEANNLEKVNHDLIEVGTDGSVLLDEITLTTNGAGVGTAISENNSTIEVRNSTINVTSYSISTNASMPVPTGVKITLTNSTFIGSDPLLLNIPCDVVIDNCTMNGTMHGMILRGGTAEVKNSTITLNYPDDDYQAMSTYFESRNWGSGNMINIAALVIGNKAPSAYQYPTKITLENTTVQSTGDHASYFPALYVYANQGAGLGVTLTYDDQCKFTGDIEYGSTNITVNGEAVNTSGDDSGGEDGGTEETTPESGEGTTSTEE